MRLMMGRLTGALALGLLATTGCTGPAGADGAPGATGAAGAAGPAGPAGAEGAAGATGANGATGATGAAGATGDAGAPGQPGEGYFPLAPNGVVGQVTNASGALVLAGTIYFVPAADVEALTATTIAKDSTNDEPLEDLIAAKAAIYQKASIDAASGRYQLATLAAGSYFVTFVPATTDAKHLPGGSLCRVAYLQSDLKGKRFDIQVSGAAPKDATYVGTSVCMTCHGKMGFTKTMHRLGIWSPYENGMLQDFSLRSAEMKRPLVEKFEANGGAGTTVYFYGYDATRGFDKWKTSETDPGNADLRVTVRKNLAGKYEMFMESCDAVASVCTWATNSTATVDAIYGGGVLKQRYLTKITSGSTFHYATLPLQFNMEGKEDAVYGRTSKTWRDYHADWWFNYSTKTFKKPTAAQSFEKNCMSCHANGSQLKVASDGGVSASVLSDPFYGDFDYDGDGVKDEMNMGCETCHGPGSAHWDQAGQGRDIVSPSLLTPEREAMICGQCHSRPQGAFGTDNPVNAEGWMMVAGTSRNDFLKNFATTQLDGKRNADGGVVLGSDFYGDSKNHSKSHHQQYSDFIRSKMYKNDSLLMTCSSCHDAHARKNPRQLRFDPTDNTLACGGCHPTQNGGLSAHIEAKLVGLGNNPGLGAIHGSMAAMKCVTCHMPKTAQTGSGIPGLLVSDGGTYWQKDISSHLFAVPARVNAQKTGNDMPTPYTRACGTCHAGP